MAGIFGNHPYDKARERELMIYLDSLEDDENNDEFNCTVCDAPTQNKSRICSKDCLKADMM